MAYRDPDAAALAGENQRLRAKLTAMRVGNGVAKTASSAAAIASVILVVALPIRWCAFRPTEAQKREVAEQSATQCLNRAYRGLRTGSASCGHYPGSDDYYLCFGPVNDTIVKFKCESDGSGCILER